jgi:hypothetical protein
MPCDVETIHGAFQGFEALYLKTSVPSFGTDMTRCQACRSKPLRNHHNARTETNDDCGSHARSRASAEGVPLGLRADQSARVGILGLLQRDGWDRCGSGTTSGRCGGYRSLGCGGLRPGRRRRLAPGPPTRVGTQPGQTACVRVSGQRRATAFIKLAVFVGARVGGESPKLTVSRLADPDWCIPLLT